MHPAHPLTTFRISTPGHLHITQNHHRHLHLNQWSSPMSSHYPSGHLHPWFSHQCKITNIPWALLHIIIIHRVPFHWSHRFSLFFWDIIILISMSWLVVSLCAHSMLDQQRCNFPNEVKAHGVRQIHSSNHL